MSSKKGNEVWIGRNKGVIIEEAEIEQKFDKKNSCKWRMELIKYTKTGDKLVRVCYYKKGKNDREYVWTNRPPVLDPDTLNKLIKQATRKEIL